VCEIVIFLLFYYTSKRAWGQWNTDSTKCVQDFEKILAGKFYVYRVVPIKLGKVIKSEAKKMNK